MHARIPSLVSLGLSALLGAGSAVAAQAADEVVQAFADNCFSPYLEAQTAAAKLGSSGAQVDFYDLRPFSAADAFAVSGRAATAGTDRRYEVAFDGQHVDLAIAGIRAGLSAEGLTTPAQIPDTYLPQGGASFVAAVYLNPNRIAVVQAGVRAHGTETFLNVERLTPLNEEEPS